MTAAEGLPTTARRLRILRRLAWPCMLLMLVVTTASAWLRLAQPRAACIDWPACRGADRPAPARAAPGVLGDARTLAMVRGTHRVAATLVLLVVIATATLALARAPRHRAAGRLALALLALALGLSVLGIVTPGSRAAGVLLGNLLGGLAMLALSWRLVGVVEGDGPASSNALARWAAVGACLWATQAVLGALAGAGVSAVAPVVHLALALPAAACAIAVGWLARRDDRPVPGTALWALTLAQILLGASAADLAAAPSIVLLHNIGAALGLALLIGLCRRREGKRL